MSKGHGKIQRQCLEVLANADEPLDSITIAARIAGRNTITLSEAESTRRALRGLKQRGAVADMGRGYRDGRRRWTTPQIGQAHYQRLLGMSRIFAAEYRELNQALCSTPKPNNATLSL